MSAANRSKQALAQWLQGRIDRWESLEKDLKQSSDKKTYDVAQTNELIDGVRGAAQDLALARQVLPQSRITQFLEGLLLQGHETVHRPPGSVWRALHQLYIKDGPRIVAQLKWTIVAAITLFILSGVAGWLLIANYTELAPLFLSQPMIDEVQSGGLWTDDLLNIIPSSFLAFSIATNNVMVTLFAFALGALYGLGTIYIISLNGLMLGGVFAYTAHYNLHVRLFEFVIAHGVVELSVICLAGAAGVGLGEALIRPGARTRSAAFREAVSRASKLLAISIPFLIGAGVIEGYISPDPSFSLLTKTAIGIGFGILFWITITGWVSRFERNGVKELSNAS